MFKAETQDINSQKKLGSAKTFKAKKLFIAAIVLLLALFAIGGVTLPNSKSSKTEKTANSQFLIVDPSPTPFPFQEMTIPYLRSRSYQSFLGEREEISQNESYTSYLTSYDSDGHKIYGLLTIPKIEKPAAGLPAIVFVHGYIPPNNYKTLVNYAPFVDYLARQGFVIFKIDLRGHGNSEGDPGGGYYSADYIIDTLNARSALQNSGVAVPGKIGLWGHSMAGNVVSRVLAAQPEIPAVVIWAGAVYTYSDFSNYRIADNSYQPPLDNSPSRKKRNELFEKYGQFDPDSEFWKQVPMTNYLDGIKGAISLNHAIDDAVVDIRYSRNFNSILDKTSIIHELNEYSSGGHNFTGETFSKAMQNTVDFFKENLK